VTEELERPKRRHRANAGIQLGWRALVVLLGVAVLILGRLLLRPTYFGSPLDPSAANVAPKVGPDHAMLETSVAPDTLPPGIEGAVLFVRLVDAAGTTVLDRPFAWPADARAVRPGNYALTAYFRGCDGSCTQLSGESDFCQADLWAKSGDVIKVEVVPSWHCTVSGG